MEVWESACACVCDNAVSRLARMHAVAPRIGLWLVFAAVSRSRLSRVFGGCAEEMGMQSEVATAKRTEMVFAVKSGSGLHG